MPRTRQTRAVLRRLAEVARPCRLHFAAIFALAMASVPLALLLPLPLKIAVDSVIGRHALPHWMKLMLPEALASTRSGHLTVAVATLVVVTILQNALTIGSWILQTYTGEKLVYDFRGQLFWHVQQLRLSSYDARGTNDLSYTIQYDAPAIQFIFLQGLLPLLTSAVTFLAFLWVTARMDREIALIALAISPLLVLLGNRSGKKVEHGYEGVKRLDSSAMLVLNEALSFARVVKAYGREVFENERFALRSRERMKAQLRLAWVQAVYHSLIVTAIGVAGIATLLVGVRHVLAHRLSTGDLALIMIYVGQLYAPLQTISGKLPEIQSWLVSARRALSILDETPEVLAPSHAEPTGRVRGDFRLENVDFEYRTGVPVLHGLNLAVPAGTRVGVLGRSGSGKSTLVNLLTRFYDPTSGSVLLDARDLRSYSLADLRRQYSILSQDPVVFSTTIAGNIAYAKTDASRDEIVAAARAADAHDFIMALPQQYDTPVGEGGIRLSGGQRQRLAIARCFLKDAPILILDEPTASVDIHTEQDIMSAAAALMRGRTVFIIAHRLYTVRDCDLFVVLEHGRVRLLTKHYAEAVAAMEESGPEARMRQPIPAMAESF